MQMQIDTGRKEQKPSSQNARVSETQNEAATSETTLPVISNSPSRLLGMSFRRRLNRTKSKRRDGQQPKTLHYSFLLIIEPNPITCLAFSTLALRDILLYISSHCNLLWSATSAARQESPKPAERMSSPVEDPPIETCVACSKPRLSEPCLLTPDLFTCSLFLCFEPFPASRPVSMLVLTFSIVRSTTLHACASGPVAPTLVH